MLPRLSKDERAAVERDLERAEKWAKNMDDHGQHNTVFHGDAERLRGVLSADDQLIQSEGEG